MKIDSLCPPRGTRIGVRDGKLIVPDDPIIPVIPGDGIGPEVTGAALRVLDRAVEETYGGRRRFSWFKVLAGEEAMAALGVSLEEERCGDGHPHAQGNTRLPKVTIDAIREHRVALKGPLATPLHGGGQSPNVHLRRALDLYVSVRPLRHIQGVPSPVVHPEKLDVVIFRENIEDVFTGIEWRQGTPEAIRVLRFLDDEMGARISEDSGIGIKSISAGETLRLARAAIDYAIRNGRHSVTIMHKGNIMKATEGAFRDWAYQAAGEFGSLVVREDAAADRFPDGVPAEVILVRDRIGDVVFQQILTRPEEYDVIVAPNLNGDYLSDACAAQIGGMGFAPGANMNDQAGVAVFEASHGSAPKLAGLDRANPSALILSGVMMLDHLEWSEAARRIENALETTIQQRTVTYDLERRIAGSVLLSCSEFAQAIVDNL